MQMTATTGRVTRYGIHGHPVGHRCLDDHLGTKRIRLIIHCMRMAIHILCVSPHHGLWQYVLLGSGIAYALHRSVYTHATQTGKLHAHSEYLEAFL